MATEEEESSACGRLWVGRGVELITMIYCDVDSADHFPKTSCGTTQSS